MTGYRPEYKNAVGSALETLGVGAQHADLVLFALSQADPDHTLRVDDGDYLLKHPMSERLESDMFECPLGTWLQELSNPPVPSGEYRVAAADTPDNGWLFVPKDSESD